MNKRLIKFFIIFLIVFEGYAQDKNDFKCGSIITSFNKEIIEYKFKSLDDLDNEIDEIVKGVGFYDPENKKEICEATVELKLEMAKEGDTIIISEIIKTSCMEKNIDPIVRHLKTTLHIATG